METSSITSICTTYKYLPLFFNKYKYLLLKKTDEDVEYFVKFATLLYKLKQDNEEKFQEYAEILRGILREQQERENK